MTKYFLEKRQMSSVEMTVDIARHLQVRQRLGKAIIVTERPLVLLSSVRRQWMKITQALQRECAKTLDARLRKELTRQLEEMKRLQFIARSPNEKNDADVYFIEEDNAYEISSLDFKTVYFCNIEKKKTIESLIQEGSVVVEYNDES